MYDCTADLLYCTSLKMSPLYYEPRVGRVAYCGRSLWKVTVETVHGHLQLQVYIRTVIAPSLGVSMVVVCT